MGTGLGNAMPPPRLFGGLQKMVARPVVAHNFQEGFGHYTDQNTRFKRWKQMRELWKSRFKCAGHWRAPSCSKEQMSCFRREYNIFPSGKASLSKCRQLINEPYTSDIGVPEAFCSLFWIKLETRLFVTTVSLKHLSPVLALSCERRRISECRLSIRLRSDAILAENVPIQANL